MQSEDRYKTRSAAVTGTGRTTFRFEASTWAAIDLVSEREGMSWVEWASSAIAARPHAKSKAAAVRAELADALLAEQYTAMLEERGPGHDLLPDAHPIVGTGYYRIDDRALSAELQDAKIILQDDSFEGFTLIVGYRAESSGGNAFVCVQNRLRGALHLFLAEE